MDFTKNIYYSYDVETGSCGAKALTMNKLQLHNNKKKKPTESVNVLFVVDV